MPLSGKLKVFNCNRRAKYKPRLSSRAQEVADHNQQLQMAQTSGDSAKRERRKRVDDDTTLPSERIEAGAREAGGQVITSGDVARGSRKKKKLMRGRRLRDH